MVSYSPVGHVINHLSIAFHEQLLVPCKKVPLVQIFTDKLCPFGSFPAGNILDI